MSATSGLLLWSKLDGPGGELDSSGNGNHGTMNQLDWASDMVDGPTNIPNAIRKRVGGDYIDYGNVMTASGDYTVSFWFRLPTANVAMWTVSQRDGVSGHFSIRLYPDGTGTMSFFHGTVQNNFATGGTPFDDTLWHHATITLDISEDTANLYFDNGDAIENAGMTSANLNYTKNFRIFEQVGGGDTDELEMCDLRVYDRIVTAQDRADIYNYIPATRRAVARDIARDITSGIAS